MPGRYAGHVGGYLEHVGACFLRIVINGTFKNGFLDGILDFTHGFAGGEVESFHDFFAGDGRLEIADIKNTQVRQNVIQWIHDYMVNLDTDVRELKGAVFEVRQGYKSKDSKRQNADLDNAAVAYSKSYLPVFTVFSSQIDNDISLRYRNGKCGILVGNLHGNAFSSLFRFCDEILLFDLAYFFQKNSTLIKRQVNDILKTLFEINEAKK